MMNTGANIIGRPSMGAWLTYGLGVTNKNLPGFVVLCPQVPSTVGPPLWSAGFLPAVNQATYVSSDTRDKNFDPYKLIPDIHNDKVRHRPAAQGARPRQEARRPERDGDLRPQPSEADPQLEATIGSMETAFRMQTEAPDVFDVRKESDATIKMYGEGSTARGCLTAARLIEKGVRMVQVYYSLGDPWDAHADIQSHRKNAKDSDQPFAALIKDLKARGLLDETIIVCGSEFGRTPVVEIGGAGTHAGRDHNPHGFSMWLAGGGIKGGTTYGADRRLRLEGRRQARPRPRHPRHHPLPHGHRPHQAHLPLQRPRLPPHRRLRQSHPRYHRLMRHSRRESASAPVVARSVVCHEGNLLLVFILQPTAFRCLLAINLQSSNAALAAEVLRLHRRSPPQPNRLPCQSALETRRRSPPGPSTTSPSAAKKTRTPSMPPPTTSTRASPPSPPTAWSATGSTARTPAYPLPRPFRRPVPSLASADVQAYTDGQLKWIIKNGIYPSGMPPSNGDFSDREMWEMVLYIRNLPKAGSLGDPAVYSGARDK